VIFELDIYGNNISYSDGLAVFVAGIPVGHDGNHPDRFVI
jgi:hypothetical protein